MKLRDRGLPGEEAYKTKTFLVGEAAQSLVPGSGYNIVNDEIIDWDDERPQPTKSEIEAEIVVLQAKYDEQEYARNRATDYPDTGEQFNKIYDDGLTKWKSEMVDPVKTKWPKDNSGPVE